MPYQVESAIIELETLTPLFIKGKDVDYGEGFLKVEDEVYSIDNDKLCQFIYESTFDELGNKRSKYDYLEWYEKYFTRIDSFDNSIEFSKFCNAFGLNYREKDDRDKETKEFSRYKEMSLQFFLESVGLLKENNEEKKKIAQKIAKGITKIPTGNKFIQKFIQNGNGKHFIPGSSIKGAIRNAVLWKILSKPTEKSLFKGFFDHHLPTIEDLINLDIKLNNQQHKEAKEIIDKSDFLKSKNLIKNGRIDKDRFKEIKKPYKDNLSKLKDRNDKTIDSISFTSLTPIKTLSQNSETTENEYFREFNQRWCDANETLRDFFRIVKISDANFDGEVRLKNKKAKAVCKDVTQTPPKSYQKSFDIDLECVPAKTKARFKISIDLNLAQDFFPSGIPFYLQSVSNLLTTVNEFFRAVAQFEETDFYNGLTSIPTDINPNDKRNAKLKVNTSQVYQLYKNKFGLAPDNLLFRTGWGGGFMSKTQFLHLTMSDRVKIRDLVRYNGSPIAPKSRCLIVNDQEAVTPLGWCKLTILPNSKLLGIDEAKVIEATNEERQQRETPNQRNFQNKPATEKEIAQSKAEANKIVKQAEKSTQKSNSHNVGDEIEMRVIQTVPFKSLTLEKGSSKLTVESNKMKQIGEFVRVEVLELKDGKITKVKLL